jgi:DNA-binding SARP family transcriptional activator
MRVVHNSLKDTQSDRELLERAKELEQDKELVHAAELYEKLIKKDPANELLYDRLMIIYRKEKEYKKELAVINAGIKKFEELHQSFIRLTPSKRITDLSKKLLKATGLADKKGRPLHDREPIARWRKRKAVVEKKIK